MMKDSKWFPEARFGAFIHWGLYAIPGGIWHGTEMDYIGEWIQARFRIPNREYAALADRFMPTRFDADLLVRRFYDAGIRYLVFTAKHHDGFAMYHSRVSRFNVMDATPFGRDPLAELAAACQKYGVRLGVYYSHCLDWHEFDGGDPGPAVGKNKGMSWGNDWDFPDVAAKDFDRYFEAKVIPQLTELFTNYGQISLLWLDCPIAIEPRHAQKIRDLVDRLMPNCLINGRIGCDMGDFGSLGDNMLPVSTADRLLESAGTLNDTWGYKINDNHWKPFAEIRENVLDLAAKGTNYLLNFGPGPDGALPDPALAVLDGLADWMRTASPAIHGTKPNPLAQELPWCRCTIAGETLYLFVTQERSRYVLCGVNAAVRHSSVPFQQRGDMLELFPTKRVIADRTPLVVELTPMFGHDIFPVDGLLNLTPAQAELAHGKEEIATAQQNTFGAAAERLANSAHSYLEESGALTQWHNPSDSVHWQVRFPEAGEYEVIVITRTRFHDDQWFGGRCVELKFNGQSLMAELHYDQNIKGGYYPSGGSCCGTLKVADGESGQLILRTVQVLDARAINMDFTQLQLIQRNLVL